MVDKSAPGAQLRLEWVYGYRGHQCRNNLFYLGSKEVVFFVAGVGVVLHVREQKQRFFLGHDDDIISLSLHPDRLLVATGQVGKAPYICVWDSLSMATVSILKDGHSHGITASSFDREGQRLVSVGLDPHATVCVWEWRKGRLLTTTRGHTDRIFDVGFHPDQVGKLVSCGVKHIKFWTLSGNSLQAKKGIFGKLGEIQTQLCLAYGSGQTTYSGTMSGDIYVWDGNNLSSVIRGAHKSAVHSIHQGEDGYASGGRDGCIRLWATDFKPITNLDLSSTSVGYEGLNIRAVCWRGDRVLAGTNDGEVYEVTVSDKDSPVCLVQGHAEGELWALAAHPTKPLFATASDDCTVRLWSYATSQLLARTTTEQAVRSCAFNSDGSHLAIGMTDGSFMVLRTKDLSQVIHLRDRKEVIHEMKFSPDGQHLAIGSNDNFVDIYSVPQRYKKVGQCSGSSSFITHLDWSEDSKHLQTNSGAAERLFYKMPSGKQLTNKEEIRAIRWATWTGVLGPDVAGIWPKYTDTTDINATDAAIPEQTIVTGDDFGLVKIFRFPSVKKGAKFCKYVGHSAHVTNCRFTSDRRRVITTGGADHAIFQWKFLPEGATEEEIDDVDDQQGAYVDSNSEESDSDMSDVDALDSDIEAEQQIKYDRDVYREDVLKSRRKARAALRHTGNKRGAAPNEGLVLRFVHGYRGYDCRNNLFYTSKAEIVYHVAAVGIVYNREQHTQRHYLEHTDDILSLALHPVKDFVATGQVGRDAAIHVWDVDTLKTASVLKGQHERGVCALDFSADGKKLASVGLDDNHSIVIWEWRKGEKLASTRGHGDKIFVVKWCPSEQNRLVTVGVKHIKFWTQTGGGFTSKRGTFGNVAKMDTMLCIAFGKASDTCYSGGSSGSIYVWKDVKLARAVKVHDGPCFAIHSLDKGFVTGGKDGVVSLWDDAFERCLKSYQVTKSNLTPNSKGTLVADSPAVRAIVLGHGHILIGTKNSEVIEIAKDGPMDILVQGHCEGEVWGLAVHPTLPLVATAGDDRTVRQWSTEERLARMISCKKLKKDARCVDFSPDGKALAVGLKDGSFVVINSETLEEIVTFHHRKQEISDIKFSPDPGKYLAVASHDNMVDIYNVLSSKRVGVAKGNSSYVTHIDWDSRGKLIATNSGAREELFFEAPRGKRQILTSSEVEKVDWASRTGVLGTAREGIWPPGADVTDVNSACVSGDGRLIATGDDFGFVKVFEYPSKGKSAKFKQYAGHSAHVTNVRWSRDDQLLLTTGGADTTLMVWSHVGAADAVAGPCRSEDSDTESEEEGYDSDVTREASMDYTTKTYATPKRQTAATKPHEHQQRTENRPAASRDPRRGATLRKTDGGATRKKRPQQVTALELECVFGYRGFDCRQNLHYLNDGADIVYHAAGAGIVLNLASGSQSFYLEHTDDIISLTLNQHPKFKGVVASGQIGADPAINIWQADTKQTLSILQGFHQKGVCSLGFSCSGKLLVSVGLDAEHSVAVWRWQDGSKVASSACSQKRVFNAEFRPDSDSTFVTVGVKHVRFWTVAGGQMLSQRGVLRPPEGSTATPRCQTMLSLAFGTDNVTYTGALSGDVYVWREAVLARVVERAHGGPVFAMYTTLRDGLIVTGAKEKVSRDGGAVKLWDQEMRRSRPFQLTESNQTVNVIKAVCRTKGKIIVGTRDSDFIEINEKSGSNTFVTCGHGEGELWGLATHPNQDKIVSASEDGTVRLWDVANKLLVNKANVGPARSADFSPDGEMIAVGLSNGSFSIINCNTFKLWGRKRDRSSLVNDVRFSPDGQYLAVATEECGVDLYDLTKGPSLDRLAFCKGIPGFVAQLDWTEDSRLLRVGNGTYSVQWFQAPQGQEVKDKRITDKAALVSWTSVIGDEVVGIWPRDAKNADVNTAHVTHAGNAIASGDDFGQVKIFPFPCRDRAADHRTYGGHSAHVTCVRFTHDDRHLVTAGGDDACLFIWRCS